MVEDMEWLKKNTKNIVIFAGPILFEISNQVSGNWVDDSGKISIGVGKFITILIGITYFTLLSYFTYKEHNKSDSIDDLNRNIIELKNKCETYEKNTKSMCDIFGYTTDKIRKQITDFRRLKTIDTYYLNITNAATIVSEQIYNNIIKLSDEKCEITVNYYRRFEEAGKFYTEMIAHEGYNSNPKYLQIKKLLKIDKNSYFCERLLADDNPDVIFLPNKELVQKTLKINGKDCKYNQYVGFPIRRIGSGEKVALIEIVAHNDSVVWKNNEDVREFIYRYCEPFKEYVLLIDMLSRFYETINEYEIGEKRGNSYAENS